MSYFHYCLLFSLSQKLSGNNVCSPFFKEVKLYRPLSKCYGFLIMNVIMCNSNTQMIYQILMRFILCNSTLPVAIF